MQRHGAVPRSYTVCAEGSARPTLRRVDHIAIPARDQERSRRFYEAADAFMARADERERFYCGFGGLP